MKDILLCMLMNGIVGGASVVFWNCNGNVDKPENLYKSGMVNAFLYSIPSALHTFMSY